MDGTPPPRGSAATGSVVVAMGVMLVLAAIAADPQWFDEHWLTSYCSCSSVTPTLEATFRWLAAGSGVALVTLARPRLTLWVSRIGPRKLLRKCAAILLAVALSLVVSDAVLRLRHKERKPAEDPVLPPMTIDSRGNFVPLASHTKDVNLGKRLVRYAIDADGNRAASSDHIADPNAPTILFTGESVGIGWGVAYEQSFPALVGAALGLQAVNVSVAGFANDQAYLRAQTALANLSHPLAVVTVALAEQLERNVRPTREHLVLSLNGRLDLQPASTSLWATSPLRKLVGYHSPESIPLTRAILQATAELARSRGAIPVFLWTNYGRPCDLSDRGTSPLEDVLFSGLGVAHVRVDIAPDQTIQGAADAHPDEKGHQALARAVLDALRGASLLAR
jgi:hypothetical protein